MMGEITLYPFPNFNGAAVWVWECISTFTPLSAGIYSSVPGQFPAHSEAGDLRRHRTHYDVIVMRCAVNLG